MRIAYFDCIGGASGDMILGALLDAGLPLQVLQDAIAALDLPGCTVEARKVVRGGLAATQAEVLVSDLASERAWPEVERLVLS
ncbi:MAG: TIGR00299 family protein, partial [Chloroflexota bacterium]